MKLQPTGRRQFLGMASIASLLGNLIPTRVLARGVGKNASTRKHDSSAEIYIRLGVRPVINAVGTVTVLGGVIIFFGRLRCLQKRGIRLGIAVVARRFRDQDAGYVFVTRV